MNPRPRDLGRKYYVAVTGGLKLKLKTAKAENERCVGWQFSRTTI